MTVTAETTNAGTYQVKTPAELERVVLRMSTKNPYVVVTRDDRAGFAQTHLGDNKATVLVEYRGGPRSMLNRAHLPREQAAQVLTGWAFDHPGWRRGISWESESMERYCDTSSHCSFTQTESGISCRLAGNAPTGLEELWTIEAVAEVQQAAHAEWFTQIAIVVSSWPAGAPTGIAWAVLLGSWVVEGPHGNALRLSAQQRARIDAVSPMSWAGTPAD